MCVCKIRYLGGPSTTYVPIEGGSANIRFFKTPVTIAKTGPGYRKGLYR